MTQRFVSASRVTAAALNADAPLGLFHPMRQDLAQLLLIVDHQDERYAVVLMGTGDVRWQAWHLDAQMGDTWGGISLGAVEVMVDPADAEYSSFPQTNLGAVTVTGGKILLGARAERGVMKMPVEIGKSGTTDGDASASFQRWQLVQRDAQGRPTVLFDTGAAQDTRA